MELRLAVDDIVIALLHFAKIDNAIFTSDRETIHRAFNNLKKENPEIMKKFNFRRRELFPESAELDQALSNLDSCGLIERYNNAPRYYKINKNHIRRAYNDFSKELINKNGIAIEELEKLAESFVRHVSAETTVYA